MRFDIKSAGFVLTESEMDALRDNPTLFIDKATQAGAFDLDHMQTEKTIDVLGKGDN